MTSETKKLLEDFDRQEAEENFFNGLSRETEILRKTALYEQLDLFVEYYGMLGVLRAYSQVMCDRYKEKEHYADLVASIASTYTHYSQIALEQTTK